MTIERRLVALEAWLRPAEAPVTWAAMWAAQQREDRRRRRLEIAILTGAPRPEEDAAAVAADRALHARWLRQRNITPDPPPTGAELERLEAKYLRLLERVDILADGTRVSYLDKLRCIDAGRCWWLPGWPLECDAYPERSQPDSTRAP